MSTFKTWKILPDGVDWVIRCQNEDGVRSRHEDQALAVEEAKQLAKDHPPSQVVIHGMDGSVVGAVHYNGLDRDADRQASSRTDPDLIGPRA